MTEGFGAFRDAISNLERAAGGGGGMVQAKDCSWVPASYYDDSSMPQLGNNTFTGKAGFWAWDENANPIDAIDEISQAAYTADNAEGIGAVPYDDWDF